MSLHLRECLEAVEDIICEDDPDRSRLRDALVTLLEFLSSPEGRTDENCTQADLFFALHDDRGVSWDHLPGPLQDILFDLGSTLHDTISTPGIAENFASTPEQLLERVRRSTLE